MIDYETRSWLGTLVHMRGSVLPKLAPRMIVYSILGAGEIGRAHV